MTEKTKNKQTIKSSAHLPTENEAMCGSQRLMEKNIWHGNQMVNAKAAISNKCSALQQICKITDCVSQLCEENSIVNVSSKWFFFLWDETINSCKYVK